jgi:hypothetical protein
VVGAFGIAFRASNTLPYSFVLMHSPQVSKNMHLFYGSLCNKVYKKGSPTRISFQKLSLFKIHIQKYNKNLFKLHWFYCKFNKKIIDFILSLTKIS